MATERVTHHLGDDCLGGHQDEHAMLCCGEDADNCVYDDEE